MESIGVFLTSGVNEVRRELSSFGVKGNDHEKLFFDGIDESNLYLCLYTFFEEDDDVREEVEDIDSGLEIKTVIGIDIGRSANSWLACLKLICGLNEKFQGEILVDDSLGDYWASDEIKKRAKKGDKEFLESYIGNEEVNRIWGELFKC